MRTTPLARRTPLPRPTTPMTRTRLRPRRATPRRRTAPRWSRDEWDTANTVLWARCGGCCEMCGGALTDRVERAHRLKRRDGGDTYANVLMLHPHCHDWTHAHPTEAGELGLILRTHQNPATTPVWHQATAWVLLTDSGTTIPTDEGDRP